jgi:thiosulfate/3-mercaptopyruvate sulfurtransferase
MTTTITTAQLAKLLNNPNVVIVDVRPTAAYNGWPLQNEARGGHIHGAVTFPNAWIKLIEPNEQRNLLESKGLLAGKTIVVYGYDEKDTETAVKNLTKLGYTDIQAYQAGFSAWAAEAHLPVQRLPSYDRLVHPEWVRQLITEQQVPGLPEQPFVLAHITFGAPEEYQLGHIPRAIHLDTNDLEDDRDWNRRSPQELLQTVRAHGITADTTVVIYGRDSQPDMSQEHPGRRAGQIAATRAAAILMYAGVKDVRFLDGGFDSWLAAGFEIQEGWNEPQPITAFGADIPANPEFLVDIDEAKNLIADPNGVLVSIRSWKEFTGDTSGYHYIGKSGRISGAVWGNCGTDAYHMQHYRNVDNTMRQYHEIEANWKEAGITAEKRIAFYCGTGWRASETLFYAYLLGWPHVAVYDGGWFEWSQDPANPIETGIPTEGVNLPAIG